MELPFSRTEFFDVFGAYNAMLWPAAVALWLVSFVFALVLVRANRPPHRGLSALLAVHWAWSGLAYHAAFFAHINPAAWMFAGLFVAQAAMFGWFGVLRGRLRFSTGRSIRHDVAALLVVYALAYPLINLAEGLTFPRMPSFGVPCPTTILTVGLLLTAETLPWGLIVIPALWSVTAGSAALLLGVRADFILFIAAVAPIAVIARRRPPRRAHVRDYPAPNRRSADGRGGG